MKKIRLIIFSLVLLAFCIVLASCDEACEHEYETTSIGAACDREVTNSKICSKCGDASYTIVAPIGHTFAESSVPATCLDNGYTEYTCDCGFSYKSDIVSAKGHNFNENVISPLCDREGYTECVCKVCGYTCNQDYIKPLGHDLEVLVINPTCEEEGYSSSACKNCDYEYISDFVEPTGHSFAETVISAVSCTTEGNVIYECECGYSYSEIVAPTGHNFTKIVIAPTVSDMGYTEHLCQCGFSYKGNYRFYSDILDNAYAGNDTVLARGIDISKWNHRVDSNGEYIPLDWGALKEAGVDYVILKIGSSVRENGTLGGIEPTFEMDYEGAKAAGIDVGVYFFTYSTNVSEIRKDAENLLEWLEGKQFEYPIYLDIEDETKEGYYPSQIAAPILTEMCLIFFSTLQKEGYYTGLYVNNEFLFNIMQTENMLELFEIWYARYPNMESYVWDANDNESYVWNTEKYGEHLGMWQYNRFGKLSPITTDVDFNYAYKNYPELIKKHGFNGF